MLRDGHVPAIRGDLCGGSCGDPWHQSPARRLCQGRFAGTGVRLSESLCTCDHGTPRVTRDTCSLARARNRAGYRGSPQSPQSPQCRGGSCLRPTCDRARREIEDAVLGELGLEGKQ